MKESDLSEEAVGDVCEPLSEVLAHFGLKLPNLSKFKASCLLQGNAAHESVELQTVNISILRLHSCGRTIDKASFPKTR